MKTILVTGGAGYIGTHTCVELLQAGYDVVVIDNLSNSKRSAVDRVREITGKHITFYEADCSNRSTLRAIFKNHPIDAVIHLAGKKCVSESVSIPLDYYHNNVAKTVVLCEEMAKYNVKKLVFSSSCTVYGNPEAVPVNESALESPTSPYGRSKLMAEHILHDLAASDTEWSIIPLRYFNPIGAHESGRIGEDPNGIPNCLIPFISQVAVERREALSVFGADYPTEDGTCIRDYIHVVDVAMGHVRALERLNDIQGVDIYNLSTGRGHSVFDVLRAFESASGQTIPHNVVSRRAGDAIVVYGDPANAERDLNWKADRTLEQMCQDAWRWQSQNPGGFE